MSQRDDVDLSRGDFIFEYFVWISVHLRDPFNCFVQCRFVPGDLVFEYFVWILLF